MKQGWLAFTIFLALEPLAAQAVEAPGSGCFTTTVASRYVWRAQVLSEGVVAQPSVEVAVGGFTANLWSNVELAAEEKEDDGIAMNETDFTLSYARPVGPVFATLGIAHYDTGDTDTTDLFLACSLETTLNPTLSLYYDIDEGDGGFAVFELSQEFPLGPVPLTAGAAVGFNLGDKAMGLNADGEEFAGLYYGEVSLAASIPLFGRVALEPRICYSAALGSDGREAVEASSVDGSTESLSGSLAVTVSF